MKLFCNVKPIHLPYAKPSESISIAIPNAWGGADEPLYTWRDTYNIQIWQINKQKLAVIYCYSRVLGEVYDQFTNKVDVRSVGEVEDTFTKYFEVVSPQPIDAELFKGLLLSHVRAYPPTPFGYWFDGLVLELIDRILRDEVNYFEIEVSPQKEVQYKWWDGEIMREKVRAVIKFYPQTLFELRTFTYAITYIDSEEWLEEMQLRLGELKAQVRTEFLTALEIFNKYCNKRK